MFGGTASRVISQLKVYETQCGPELVVATSVSLIAVS